jgi:hypothetical protein
MATLFSILPYGTNGNSFTGVANTALTDYNPTPLITWGQGIGTAISGFGWTKDTTPTGTVNWSTVTIAPNIRTDWTNFPADGALNFRGAWSNAAVTYNVRDVVTDNGMTWMCSAGYTTSASSPSPSNEWQAGGTQHWFLWCFEVWKSAGSVPIYIRFEYLAWGASGQSYLPWIRVKVGTSTDVNGTLGTGTGQQAMGAFGLGNGTSTQAASTSVIEGGLPCFFSGDSTNRFAMLMWLVNDSYASACFFCVERSLSSTGTYVTTPSGNQTPYWTAIWAGFAGANSTGQTIMQSVVNTTGTTWVKTGQESTVTTLSCALDHEVNPDNFSFWTGQGYGNQSTPSLPIFPLVGWVGNPMTAAASFRTFNSSGSSGGNADLPGNSGLFTQTIYGASHTYLATRNANVFGQFGPPNNNTGSSAYMNALAMRYD